MPLHARPRPSGVPLSRRAWRRLRRTTTIGLFVVATVVGVTVGVQGAAVSPVAPAPSASTVVAAADRAPMTDPAPPGTRQAGRAPVGRHGHGGRR
jgi:hypothetical protein